MQPRSAPPHRWLLPTAVLFLAACGESQAPGQGPSVDSSTPPAPGDGVVAVTVEVTGLAPDDDGFGLVIDGAEVRRFATSQTNLRVRSGRHVAALTQVRANCVVADNDRAVEVGAGATVTVSFAVSCRGGRLRWLLRAPSGVAIDPDGYDAQLRVDGRDEGPVVRVGVRDTTVLRELPVGAVDVQLIGLWPSCAPGAEPTTVVVSDSATSELQTAPVCSAIRRGGIVMSDGWRIWRFADDVSAPIDLGEGYAPAWSPDGQRIAFALPQQFSHEFFSLAGASVMDANGRLLVQAFAESAFPRILPDGRLLANDSVFEADGHVSSAPLWRVPAGYRVLDWDREVSTLLVARSTMDPRTGDQLGPDTLALAATDGRLLGVLWVSRGLMMKARFAPDGRRIAVNLDSNWSIYERSSFNNMCGADCGIWVLERDGSRRSRIAGRAARDFTPEGAYFDYGPLAWSPESARVLYARGDFAKGYELVHARADDGGDVQLVWRSRYLPYADWR